MKKAYRTCMPIKSADVKMIRLSAYGLAYQENQKFYTDLCIVDITENIWTNFKNETRNLEIIIEYVEESRIN